MHPEFTHAVARAHHREQFRHPEHHRYDGGLLVHHHRHRAAVHHPVRRARTLVGTALVALGRRLAGDGVPTVDLSNARR